MTYLVVMAIGVLCILTAIYLWWLLLVDAKRREEWDGIDERHRAEDALGREW